MIISCADCNFNGHCLVKSEKIIGCGMCKGEYRRREKKPKEDKKREITVNNNSGV